VKISDYVVTGAKDPIVSEPKTPDDPFVGKYHSKFLPGGIKGEIRKLDSKNVFKEYLLNVIDKYPAN
jgi:hypothetical protein